MPSKAYRDEPVLFDDPAAGPFRRLAMPAPAPGRAPRGCPPLSRHASAGHADGRKRNRAQNHRAPARARPGGDDDIIRHIVRKTHDPRQRYENGLRLLSAAHYQDARAFSDVLTGLFSVDSTVAATLVAEGRCVLHFEQGSQGYQIPCTVRELEEEDAAYQATYWHNCLFNPALPPEVRLLAFDPDWARANAVPPV